MRSDLLERYRGRWVAVDAADEVLADDDQLGALLERVVALGIHADTVQRVPGIGEPVHGLAYV